MEYEGQDLFGLTHSWTIPGFTKDVDLAELADAGAITDDKVSYRWNQLTTIVNEEDAAAAIEAYGRLRIYWSQVALLTADYDRQIQRDVGSLPDKTTFDRTLKARTLRRDVQDATRDSERMLALWRETVRPFFESSSPSPRR